MIRALVKAHRWRRRIESGKAKSITDVAAQEGVPVLRSSSACLREAGASLRRRQAAGAEGGTDAYVCRLLPLTCLAPDIVEAILDGRQPKGFKLADLLRGIPLAWEEQRRVYGFSPRFYAVHAPDVQ